MEESLAGAAGNELFQLIKKSSLIAFEMVCNKYPISLLNIAYMRIGNREDALGW
jgi:hypothetical protein